MKRSQDTEIKYAVLETNEDEKMYVEFMPQLWLVPINDSPLKERNDVGYFFPSRLERQSKDNYFRFVKQAKYLCTKPQNDGKWQLKKGRILKLGIGSLEDALSSQKYYSDYFSTTEAEREMIAAEELASSSKKVIRRKKKAVTKSMNKTMDNSDSDECENREVSTISNYNFQFATDASDLFSIDASNNFLPIDMAENVFASESENLSSLLIRQTEEAFTDQSNEVFVTLNVPINEGAEELYEEQIGLNEDLELTAADDNNDSQHFHDQNNGCCKGHQKVINKIDYVQKKILKELGLLRQETNSNRKLFLQLLQTRRPCNDETESNRGDEIDTEAVPAQTEDDTIDMVEFDEFTEKCKAIFPIKECDFMIDFNKSLKLDQKFAEMLSEKLNNVKGDNEIKTARKILKFLCNFRCLKDFTWMGTKKMKSFQDLHLIVGMITKILKGKYPACDAMDTLTKVVQQRTKSSKEAWVKYLTMNKSSSVTVADEEVQNSTENVIVESTIAKDMNENLPVDSTFQ